jgi:hypothetical protein
MGGTCSKLGEIGTAYKVCQGKKPLRKPRNRWEVELLLLLIKHDAVKV